MNSIRFNIDSVLSKLTQVSSVVCGKSTMPIFECVRFKNDAGLLTLMASDGETWCKEFCTGVAFDFDFDFCVNAKNIVSTFRNLAGVDIGLEVDTEKKLIFGHYGKQGKFQLPIIDGSDFIEPISIDESTATKINIIQTKLLDAINNTEFSTANDELRPVMNGIHFDVSDECMECAASDGTQLVHYVDYSVKGTGGTKGFTLPTKPAKVIAQIINGNSSQDVSLVFNNDNVRISGDDWQVTTRLCAGRYPNYKSVIPAANPNKAVLDKEQVLSILNRILPFGNGNSKLVKLSFDERKQEVLLSTEDVDWSTCAQESMDCEYSGNYLTIGFKGDLFVQIIKNIKDGKVVVEMHNGEMAAVFKPLNDSESTKYVSILMPMRID